MEMDETRQKKALRERKDTWTRGHFFGGTECRKRSRLQIGIQNKKSVKTKKNEKWKRRQVGVF